MKTKNNRVETRFGPPVRFKVRPASHRLAKGEAGEFERLKERLLSEELNGAPNPKAGPALRRAAMEAAAVAWTTPYPLLVFPELVWEKAAAANSYIERQETVLRRSKSLLTMAA
jgi:hypothetical protein